MAYKESVAVTTPPGDDNDYEETPSTASASAHLLHHEFQFKEARTEKPPPIWRRLKNNVLGRGRRRYTVRSEERLCAECGKRTSGRQTPLRKCISAGFWVFALL